MSLIIGFLGFWYDFIVGDAWEIELGVIIVLTLGAALLRTNSVDQEISPAAGRGRHLGHRRWKHTC